MSGSINAGAVDTTPIAVPTDLQSAGTTLNQHSAAVVDELNWFKGQLQPLQGTWTGSAAVYYEGLQAEWDAAATGLFGPDGVISQIAKAMDLAWSNYQDAESDNSRAWKS